MPSQGRLTRRRMLAASGAGITVGLAGCLGGSGGSNNGGSQPTTTSGDSTATPSQYIQPGDTGEEVHILTDYSNDNWQKVWEDSLTPEFEAEVGVDFKAEYVGFQGSGEQRLTTLIQSGNAPESFTGGITQTGDMLVNGQTAPVTHVVDYLVENNGELLGQPDTVFGDNYIVPHGKYTSTWHYRTDHLETVGMEPPETLGELYDAAKAIDEHPDIDARGATVAAPKAGMSDAYYVTMLYSHGAFFFEWEDQEKGIAKIWWPEKAGVAALEYMQKLSEFSPDPTSVNWGSTLGFWAGNRVAMMYHLNAWGAGVAANADNLEIAENTDVRPIPTLEGTEAFARGSPGFDGHNAINIAGNVPGWLTILQYMYEDSERSARYYLTEPTRFLPAYQPVMDTDAYRNAEVFKRVPNLLRMNEYCRDVVAPLEATGDDLAQTPATIFSRRFPIISEMVNEVIVSGRDPTQAYREAKDRLAQRLEEGQELVDENF